MKKLLIALFLFQLVTIVDPNGGVSMYSVSQSGSSVVVMPLVTPQPRQAPPPLNLQYPDLGRSAIQGQQYQNMRMQPYVIPVPGR